MNNKSVPKYLIRLTLVGMKANIRKIDQIPKLLIIISITIPDEIAFDNPSN